MKNSELGMQTPDGDAGKSPLDPPKSGGSTPAAARVSVGTYVLAVISGVFVTFGALLCFAFSHLFFGNWIPTAPKLILAAVPTIAVGLGILSAWRSIVIAKRKLIEKEKQ